MENLILAATPGEITAAGAWGHGLAHLSYRVGEGPHLFRANFPVAPRGGLMVIDDSHFRGGGEAETFCNEILRECAARKFHGVVCRFLSRPHAALTGAVSRLGELCHERGMALYVTEGYGGASHHARVILSTALSGGSLKERLDEAVSRFGSGRVCIWAERTAEDFLLPSPGGAGAPLTTEELQRRREETGAAVFFSPELCAHYFTYMAGEKGHFVLFDDAGSIRKKIHVAREAGIDTAFLPYGPLSDIMGELLG